MPGGAVRAVAVFGICLGLPGPADAAPPLLDAAGQLHPAWQLIGLPQARKPLTRFTAERLDGHAGVRIVADHSYGNWVHTLAPPAALRTLRWSWRVDQPNPQTQLASKAGDDVAARVCVSFELPLDRLSFLERQKLLLARTVSQLDLSAATLCYVWGGHEARGALIDNVYTRRVRQIVLRNADDALRTWYDEQRDVAADFLRAFHDEAHELPPATVLMIGGDTDNSGAHTLAHVADLQASP